MLCTKNKLTYIHPSEKCVVCLEEVVGLIKCKFCLSGAVCETCYHSMVEHHLENCPVCRKPEWNILLTEISTEESPDSSTDEPEASETPGPNYELLWMRWMNRLSLAKSLLMWIPICWFTGLVFLSIFDHASFSRRNEVTLWYLFVDLLVGTIIWFVIAFCCCPFCCDLDENGPCMNPRDLLFIFNRN